MLGRNTVPVVFRLCTGARAAAQILREQRVVEHQLELAREVVRVVARG